MLAFYITISMIMTLKIVLRSNKSKNAPRHCTNFPLNSSIYLWRLRSFLPSCRRNFTLFLIKKEKTLPNINLKAF